MAARIDLAPGLDSEAVELVCVRIKRLVTKTCPEANHVFLDITEAPANARPSQGASRIGLNDASGGTNY
ncbi:hypothetical protein [Streptomyces sp. NRRL S-1824]|uniref:hypothetical protein n=1 Tax=Streptomyces sp. NRRL S-1824 TaxID=1463889 RepID=UPI0004C76D24